MVRLYLTHTYHFNPRSPCGERRARHAVSLVNSLISIHAPRVGSDEGAARARAPDGRFQSTLPVWGATRRVRRAGAPWLISIHAPRVGSDGMVAVVQPHVGPFQSTLPVWGATTSLDLSSSVFGYFNPRSPCGERRGLKSHSVPSVRFQSTLPVWGATRGLRATQPHHGFQSTLPVWGATAVFLLGKRHVAISIHAPRVGSDAIPPRQPTPRWNFNPRSPCGERRRFGALRKLAEVISIHAPRVGSDDGLREVGKARGISIHAPRVGSDTSTPKRTCLSSNFNPRSPCGERPKSSAK